MSNYDDGYRDGHLDAYIGLPPSQIALTWPGWSLPGYAQGYYDGYFGFPYERWHNELDVS